jgi:hypothetical protein
MLFDLRGRGRRRTVQVIYVFLALLIGVGLVGFGIGGGFGSGGLLNAANNNEGSGGAGYSGEIKKYKKLVAKQPTNVTAWEKLIDAQLHQAGNEGYVTGTGEVTSKGRALYSEIAQSWNHYLALNPPAPNPELAQRMVAVFGEEGLKQPSAAVQVLQIAVAARPTSKALYAQLAVFAYKSHNPRVGDLAAAKAIALTPASEQARLKSELATVKKSPNLTESYTGSTNGTTYVGTTGANKSFTATSTTTTPAPVHSTSTGK